MGTVIPVTADTHLPARRHAGCCHAGAPRPLGARSCRRCHPRPGACQPALKPAARCLRPRSAGCSTRWTSCCTRSSSITSAPASASTTSMSGLLLALPLAASAFGGALFGWIADRRGRVTALRLSILVYSVRNGRLRVLAVGAAARRRAPGPRPRHRRRVGDWRRARRGDMAGRAPRQGARHHAERLGDRATASRRPSTRSCCRGSAGAPSFSSACCRRSSCSGFAVTWRSPRSGVRAGASRTTPRRIFATSSSAPGPGDVDGHGDARGDDVRVVGAVFVDPVVSDAAGCGQAAPGSR